MTTAMKTIILTGLVGALTFAASTANAGGKNSTPKVKIHPALRITNLEGLQFGTIAPNLTTGDTVVVNAAVDDTSNCGALLTCMVDGDRARFRITGRGNMPINVTVSSAITLSNGSGGTMLVDNFVLNGSGFGSGSGFVQGNGAIELGVGGTLHVGANQQPGNYTGTFQVTATYQ